MDPTNATCELQERLIPNPKLRLRDQVAGVGRCRHMSLRTEDPYCQWIRRSIHFHNKRHPTELGSRVSRQFPRHLAVHAHVPAGTQNQAPNRRRMPVVLSREEVGGLLSARLRLVRGLASPGSVRPNAATVRPGCRAVASGGMMARTWFHAAWVGLVLLGWPGAGSAADGVLPQGETRAALVSPHFPDRVHEFVWRNWNVIEPARLAKVIGASTAEVTALARSMGLPPGGRIPKAMRDRGYVTIIRRNWHLLPYEQLLTLLDLTPERLAFTLREEDFLWIKLGRLKPACASLRYHAPEPAAQARAAAIRRVVEEEFGPGLRQPSEPRFEFVRQLSKPVAKAVRPPREEPSGHALRLVYSYVAVYGDPLLNPELNPYPDGLLERLAAAGVNGVWLHAVLRDLAPGGSAFPEFGADHERRLAQLRVLVRRAARYGIGVYLYLNEPRAMPAAFLANRPATGGVTEDGLTALCTSDPTVRQWLGDALEFVFRQVPGLGGVYAITASENLTNCASHGGWQNCPRCRERTDTDIIAEVVRVLEAGVHRGNPTANVVVSDWGWKGHGDAVDVIARLPASVWLMSVSEWALPIERGGIKSQVGEYSISSVGPGPRATRHWAAARAAGLRIASEVQLNNTCEIASLPYLPVLDLVAEHCRNLSSARLDGMLIGWTMGGYPSPNLQLARDLCRTPAPDTDAVLLGLAKGRYGVAGAGPARRAWTLMSDAFREYPFHVSVVYTSPVQCGPANPLYAAPTGYRATMWGIPYDDLDGWRGPYPAEVFAAQFERMATGWRAGLVELEAAVEKAPAGLRAGACGDLRLARAAGIHFASVANQARFVLARDALAKPSTAAAPEERERWRRERKRLLTEEIGLAHELFGLVQEDSRIGFEPSCQYFYLPLDLVEKVINCRWLLARDGE